jgi:hypothetical protein
VIAWRQAVFADFMRNSQLVDQIETLLSKLATLKEPRTLLGGTRRSLLLETSDRLAELDVYIDIIQTLSVTLSQSILESTALTTLRDNLLKVCEDENYQFLRDQLPALRQPLESIASLTIGVNLDLQLQPTSVVLLEVNDYRFAESASFLDRLIGISDNNSESGIAPVHYTPREADLRPFSPLFQDLDRLMKDIAEPVANALNRYTRGNSDTLMRLEYELAFYVLAAKLIRRLRDRGVTFCQPDIAPKESRYANISALMNIDLAIRDDSQPVPSDVQLGESGRIAILTGPNSGGKTTYLCAVGLAQVMFQTGLFIPAKQAHMSPADKILTHFPALETRQQGRLEEEARRLREILHEATQYSLIFLNETFSSTSSSEAVYLGRDILAGLRAIGVRAIYTTHFVELTDQIDDIMSMIDGDSDLMNLVAVVRMSDDGQIICTYQIERGDPHGQSYAREIARRHGISLEQIIATRSQLNGDRQD